MKGSKRSKNDRLNWGIGRRSRRRWAACLRAAVLALTVIVPVYPAERASAASATMASQGGFTQDQLDELAYQRDPGEGRRRPVGAGCEIDAGVLGSRGLLQYHPLRRIVGPSGGAF